MNSYLKKHVHGAHENPKSFECEVCCKKFNLHRHLKLHRKIHDENRSKPFKCQRCGFATDTNQRFKKHVRFHETKDKKFSAMKNPLKCEKCPTLCRNKGALGKHLITVHPKIFFQCDLCGSYKDDKSTLRGHIKFHLKLLAKEAKVE